MGCYTGLGYAHRLCMEKQERARPIIIRYTLAVVGAASITIALLLLMNDLVNRFILREPVEYFAIASFLPAPDRGRQLPDAPPSPAAAPDTPELEYENSENVVVDVPIVDIDTTTPIAEQPLNLDD